MSFPPDPALLCPAFQSYKLHPTPSHTLRFHLASPPTLQGGDPTSWGWKESRARARWNHLLVCGGCGAGGGNARLPRALWVGEGGKVWAAEGVGADSTRIHTPLTIPSPPTPPTEYPAIHSLLPPPSATRDLFLVSSGSSTLHLVSLPPEKGGQVFATANLRAPLKLHCVSSASPDEEGGTILYAVASAFVGSFQPSPSKTSSEARYDLLLLSLHMSPDTRTLAVKEEARLQGDDAPGWVAHDRQGRQFIVGASCAYSTTTPAAVPSPQAAGSDEELSSSTIQTRGLYSFSQSPTHVILLIPLPSAVDPLSVDFSPSSFHVCPAGATHTDRLTAFHPSPTLWGPIDPSASSHSTLPSVSSSLTASAEQVLHIALAKRSGQEGGRWPHVFQVDDGVAESLSPGDVAAFASRVDHFTSSPSSSSSTPAQGQVGHAGLGGALGPSGRGVAEGAHGSALFDGEVDMEIDDFPSGGSAGDRWRFTFIPLPADGVSPPAPSRQDGLPIAVLSTPLDLSSSAAAEGQVIGTPSVVVQDDVDGLLFAPPQDESEKWHHALTFPALSFVLASKRDARFVRHLTFPSSASTPSAGAGAALVLESKPGIGAGNLFVYSSPESTSGKGMKVETARQEVVRIGSGDSGAVVGFGGAVVDVGETGTESGELVIIVLCEKELVVAKGLF